VTVMCLVIEIYPQEEEEEEEEAEVLGEGRKM
jgi:hypothetical protein